MELSGQAYVFLVVPGLPYFHFRNLAFNDQLTGGRCFNFINTYTPAGYGTEVAEGKETREFDGKMHVLEKAFEPDFAIVKAWKGDTEGNLIFKGTARNFNPMMAMAGKVTIAEVEELVEPGTLDPNFIHTPGIFVQRIFQGEKFEKRIEQRTVRQRN